MREHFAQGVAARDAVIADRLGEARASFARLASERDPMDTPATWTPRLAALRELARRGASAHERAETAASLGELAVACGECHEATGARLPLARLEAAENAPTPLPMGRHHWAAERMWEGLIAPERARFREGATVLAEAPLHPAELVAGSSPPLAVVALAERTRTLAAEASQASSSPEQARLYGELLTTCAACHAQR
jgi:cytochrome c553